MPDREQNSSRRQLRFNERTSPKGSSCTPLGHGKSELLRLNEENEEENRDEATQRSMEELCQRQCGGRRNPSRVVFKEG